MIINNYLRKNCETFSASQMEYFIFSLVVCDGKLNIFVVGLMFGLGLLEIVILYIILINQKNNRQMI